MNKTILLIGLLVAVLAAWSCRDSDGDGDADADADGDGGGDGDGDADGDDDGDETPFECHPPLGVCDAVYQCGCGDGQFCDVAFDGATAMTSEFCQGATGGTGVHGTEGCSIGTCAPGHFCNQEADPDGAPITVCRRWCLEDEHCADYPGSHCSREICYVDGAGNPIGCVEPYKLCSPEDVGLGAGTAEFSVCTGYREDCPGNPPFSYSIAGGVVNGRCDIDLTADPAELTFNLHDVGQSISITGNALAFDFGAAGSDFTDATTTETTRFTVVLPGGTADTYSTQLLANPPGNGYCHVEIRYRAAEEGFDLNFTCNHIEKPFTDIQLVTIVDDELGPGTLSMDGCLINDGT